MTCPHSLRGGPCSQCAGVTPRRIPVGMLSFDPNATQDWYREAAKRGGAGRWRGKTRLGVVSR